MLFFVLYFLSDTKIILLFEKNKYFNFNYEFIFRIQINVKIIKIIP